MEIHLIRHTAPDIEKGICYGQSDVPLVKPFEAEFLHLHEQLPPVDILYSSPLSRCKTLADYLGKERGVPVVEDVRLMELNFGAWEMKRWDDIDQAVLLPWMDNYETMRCPGGESYNDLVERIYTFVEDIRKTGYSPVAAVVTHGGAVRAFSVVLNNVLLKESMDLEVKYGGIYSYRA